MQISINGLLKRFDLMDLKKISKTYKSSAGNFEVLKNIELIIKKKQTVFLFGPSGCGKSTFLNIIAGLDIPDEGAIYFEDKLISKNHSSLLKKDLGIVFQDHYLISELDILDNIKLKSQSINDINEILDYFQVSDLKNKFPNFPYSFFCFCVLLCN